MIEFRTEVIKTEDTNELFDAFNQYNSTSKVLIDDGYHRAKHRTPHFQAGKTFVCWMNCNERVIGYKLLYSRRKNKKENKFSEWQVDLFYFLV